ncbi:hypothetical protein GGS26DRAFT_93579 [Hypomontagnella submonticulosa]|nr:hypothetical protein GGS26DRAFT_93579 [Hypomontagnella submonticulosa]
MQFSHVRIEDVRTDIHVFGLPQDDHTEYRPSRFNTFFHPETEAPGLHRPSELPYSFGRWGRFILRERNQRYNETCQTITLSTDQARLLLSIAQQSIPSLRIVQIFRAEFDRLAPAFAELRFPNEGLFMRLDSCSAKDAYRGHMSLHTVDDVILRLVTSERVQAALTKALTPGAESLPYPLRRSGTIRTFEVRRTGEEPLEVYFLPFDHRIHDQHKYRVFCPPVAWPRLSRISGISQFEWYTPWLFHDRRSHEIQRLGTRIATACNEIRGRIVARLDRRSEMDHCFLYQGFTFDVWYDEGADAVNLIGLNAFGARSGTGSCLFQWIIDRDLLYSTNPLLVPEFRATW